MSRRSDERADGFGKNLNRCKDLLSRMMRDERARFFLEPVDPVALNLPDYLELIKRPMDLGTMMKKAQAGEYQTAAAFAKDMRLVFNNAEEYNDRGSIVTKHAKFMRKYFESKFRDVCPELAAPEQTNSRTKKRKVEQETAVTGMLVNLPTKCRVCLKVIYEKDPLHLNQPQCSPTQAFCGDCVAKGEQITSMLHSVNLSIQEVCACSRPPAECREGLIER